MIINFDKYIKESVDNQFFKTKKEIEYWIYDNVPYTSFTINDDLTVDIRGNLDIRNRGLEYLPVQFNVVTGNIRIDNNHFKNLKGFPKICLGYLTVGWNDTIYSLIDIIPDIIIKTIKHEVGWIYNGRFQNILEEYALHYINNKKLINYMLCILGDDFKLNHKELFEYQKHSKIITFNKKHFILENLFENRKKNRK
jgi:hypothetical protein